MERIDYRHDGHAVRFALVVGGLSLIAGGLIVMLVISLWSVSDVAGRAIQRPLVYVAWVSLVLLCGVLILLGWMIMRHIKLRLLARERRPPVEHPDAWVAAGKRLKLDDSAPNSSGRWRSDDPPRDEE